jgi:Rps23 Pro-64 3,4-dihydroxylase Tpa1-like proline 4-hydroxylase
VQMLAFSTTTSVIMNFLWTHHSKISDLGKYQITLNSDVARQVPYLSFHVDVISAVNSGVISHEI